MFFSSYLQIFFAAFKPFVYYAIKVTTPKKDCFSKYYKQLNLLYIMLYKCPKCGACFLSYEYPGENSCTNCGNSYGIKKVLRPWRRHYKCNDCKVVFAKLNKKDGRVFLCPKCNSKNLHPTIKGITIRINKDV